MNVLYNWSGQRVCYIFITVICVVLLSEVLIAIVDLVS